MNLVLCGSNRVLKSSISDLILGQRELRSESRSVCVKREAEVCGRLISLVELPALYSSQLSEEEVMRETLRCVSLCDPGVHAFLFILPEGLLTDEDKGELEKIQRTFNFSRFDNRTIVLITQQHLKQEIDAATMTFSKNCSGGYYHFGPVPDVSELIKKVQKMVLNDEDIYTPVMFLNAQLKKQARRYKIQEANMKTAIHKLESNIQRQLQGGRASTGDVRIVVLGEYGSGKSATGNTILGSNLFEVGRWLTTNACQKEFAEVSGRLITVIDTPGLFEGSYYGEINKEVTKSIAMVSQGLHVFLLVLDKPVPLYREKDFICVIQETFGKQCWAYTIILFTTKGYFDKINPEEYKRSKRCMGSLMYECGNRYHVFDNRSGQQVTDLLEKIDCMVAVNGGSFYTNEMFQRAIIEKQQQKTTLMQRLEETGQEKKELKVKYEAEMEELKKIMQKEKEKQEAEARRREEEFKEKVQQIKQNMEQMEQLEREHYRKRREEDEKRMKEWIVEVNRERKQ